MDYLILNDKAVTFTRELFKMTKPVNAPGDITLYQYQVIRHSDGRFAVVINLQEFLIVAASSNVDDLIKSFFPNITQNKLNQVRTYVKNKTSIQLLDLLQNYVTIYTHQQMVADGWFQTSII